MPFKNPADKAAWRRARQDKNQAEKRACEARQREKRVAAILQLPKIEQAREYLRSAGIANVAAAIIASYAAGGITPAQRRDRAKAVRGQHRAYRERLRVAAIEALGGACEACGMDVPEVLEFDHIEPIKRRTNGVHARDSATTHRQILSGEAHLFQLLCANCHTLKTRMNGEFVGDDAPRFAGIMQRFDCIEACDAVIEGG